MYSHHSYSTPPSLPEASHGTRREQAAAGALVLALFAAAAGVLFAVDAHRQRTESAAFAYDVVFSVAEKVNSGLEPAGRPLEVEAVAVDVQRDLQLFHAPRLPRMTVVESSDDIGTARAAFVVGVGKQHSCLLLHGNRLDAYAVDGENVTYEGASPGAPATFDCSALVP